MKQVYFIRRIDGTGPIKIGYSTSVNNRVRLLSREYRAEFSLLAAAPGDFQAEKNLHLKFSSCRLAPQEIGRPVRKTPIYGITEWFSATPELLEFIDIVRATGELPLLRHERRELMVAERYLAGETLQQIANDYGLTRERVRKILRDAGVPSLGMRPEHCWRRRALLERADAHRIGTRLGGLAVAPCASPPPPQSRAEVRNGVSP